MYEVLVDGFCMYVHIPKTENANVVIVISFTILSDSMTNFIDFFIRNQTKEKFEPICYPDAQSI